MPSSDRLTTLVSSSAHRLSVLYLGRLPPHHGGSSVVGTQILRGLARAGHRVRALAPVTKEGWDEAGALARAHPELGLHHYEVPYFEGSRRPAAQDDHFRTVQREAVGAALPPLIADARPDVVLIGQEAMAWAVMKPIQAYRLPSILVVHGGSTYASLVGLDFPEARGGRLLEEFRKIDAFVAVAWHLAMGLERLGLRRVHTIPNTVDVSHFRPRPPESGLRRALDIGDSDVVVLHASDLKPFKRPLDLAAAVEAALARNPRLLCLVVGEGPERAGLEEACRRRGVIGRFRFTGWVEHARMPDYLARADLVVQPPLTRAWPSCISRATRAAASSWRATSPPPER